MCPLQGNESARFMLHTATPKVSEPMDGCILDLHKQSTNSMLGMNLERQMHLQATAAATS